MTRFCLFLPLFLLLVILSLVESPSTFASPRPVPWGSVWTSYGIDHQNPLKVQWVRGSSDRWVLDTFYYASVRNFFSSKEVGPGRAPRLRLLNRAKLTFNPRTGIIYLGEREVGAWRGSSGSKGQGIRNVYELTADVRIDPLRKTIRILTR